MSPAAKVVERIGGALADMNVWAAIEAIAENSIFSPDAEGGAERLRKLCQSEIGKAHRRFETGLSACTRERQS